MPNIDFELGYATLESNATQILDRALSLGASSAALTISESAETVVDVLKGNIENFATSYDSNLSLNVYIGHNKGSVGISGTKIDNVDNLVKHALDIAKYTEADANNGIAEKEIICTSFSQTLELYNPIDLSNQELINKARNIEDIALKSSDKISNSNGASVSISKYNFILATTNGINLGYKTTRYDSSLSVIGGNEKDGMQTDYWHDACRDFNDLIIDEKLANMAVNRTLRRLNKGKFKSGVYPVIFEYPIAKSLIANFLSAINGNNLYRKLSFLNDSINTSIFPTWVNIDENPFIIKGLSSCYFDNEGVNVQKRRLVESGTLRGYQLNCYSARKMHMQSTGNSGGNHNISVIPNFSGDINKLAATMHNGLIVIETIGHGLNMVTGDYSVGASGLWVKNGQIQFFVDNLTIAGNLKQIYHNIQYISDDYNNGSILCGSMLVDGVSVST